MSQYIKALVLKTDGLRLIPRNYMVEGPHHAIYDTCIYAKMDSYIQEERKLERKGERGKNKEIF